MSGESLDRYFRLIRDDRHRRPSGRLWCPAADVYRSKDGWIVKIYTQQIVYTKEDMERLRSEGKAFTSYGMLD